MTLAGTGPKPLSRARDWRRPRLFLDQGNQGRSRRATDLVLLLSTVIGTSLLALAEVPQLGFSQSIELFFTNLPSSMHGVWQIFADLPFALAALVAISALLSRHLAVARDLLLAAAFAALAWMLLTRAIDGQWLGAGDTLWATEGPRRFPAPRLAIPGAVLVAASPHLVVPARRIIRWALGLAAAATVALSASSPLGAVAGLLVATGAAAAVHLVFGSGAGRPSLADVQAALRQLGVPAEVTGAAESQPSGVFVAKAQHADGSELSVKIYGRDAYDAAMVGRAWRTIWFRDPGAAVGFGRLQQVEHEAFLTLLAQQGGVRTETVITAQSTESDDAILVLRSPGQPLLELSPSEQGHQLAELWQVLDRLHGADIAHGELDAEHLSVFDGELGLSSFRAASAAPSDAQLRTDNVQALVTIALLLGGNRALDLTIDALGQSRVAAMLPFLQMATLTPSQRHSIRHGDFDLDDFRELAATAADVEAPKLQQLRRFTIGSIVRIVLPLIALYIIASAISNFDMAQVADELSDAIWWIAALAFLIAQLPRLAQAVATMGASPVPLPLGPVYALQLSVSYVNLVIPSTAARMAVNIRFFQRHSVPPGGALAAGALDGLSGFIIQALLLGSMLIFGSQSLDLSLSAADSGPAFRLLLIILGGLLVTAVILVAIARVRQFIIRWAKQILGEAGSALRGLRSPRRLLMLFGGNIASELLFAGALGLFAAAVGFQLGIGELLFINVCVSLLAGLIPVPGGIGVTEGGLTYGLVAAGMDQEAAFAAVIMYRIATFYVPPVWGFFAFRWLERNEHL